jgi:nucleoside 2-deoxyribosyltransferase
VSTLPLVYIAGPYTSPDPVENTHDTIRIATRLYESGHLVPLVPHLTLLWHLVEPRPPDFWYAYDMHLLRRCDAVLVLPGLSPGADLEVTEAKRLEIPTFDNESDLLMWALQWSAAHVEGGH